MDVIFGYDGRSLSSNCRKALLRIQQQTISFSSLMVKGFNNTKCFYLQIRLGQLEYKCLPFECTYFDGIIQIYKGFTGNIRLLTIIQFYNEFIFQRKRSYSSYRSFHYNSIASKLDFLPLMDFYG